MKIKIKRKHRKGQVIFIETILVICTYIFLLGFMLSCFQIFHTKMVFNIAAYQGTRTALMVMDDKQLAQDWTKEEFYNSQTTGLQEYSFSEGENLIKDFCEKNCIAYSRINNGSGVNVDYIESDGGVFVQCTVSGNIRYIFPLISPNFIFDKEPIRNDINLVESSTMARRRIFKGAMASEDQTT